MTKNKTFCGRIAIVGRPNVGKSTLINKLLGEPVSIATHKSHTTRHCILGVKNKNNVQMIFIDTPGIHVDTVRLLNKKMNQVSGQALHTADVILWLTDRERWQDDDAKVASFLTGLDVPIIWCINKIDRAVDSVLNDHVQSITQKYAWIKYFLPISARSNLNLLELEDLVASLCPESEHSYPKDVLTNRDNAFMASETIRAKLFKYTHQEVPYSTHVTIDEIKQQSHRVDIQATLWVEKVSQRKIIIGKGGQNIKKIGTDARLTLCDLLDNKVNLKLWVRCEENWADSQKSIDQQNLSGEDVG